MSSAKSFLVKLNYQGLLMKLLIFLMASSISFSLLSAEVVLYQFECPRYGYAGEVYQDRAVIKKQNYNDHTYETVAYYVPKDEDNDYKLKYNKFSHELELTLITGEMSEIGYARYRDKITLNLNTNDIVDAYDWMLIPIPFWKNIRETEIDGKDCRVLINRLRKPAEKPYNVDWKKSDRAF